MELELNELFLPLLGGFLFYYSFHGTQYVATHRPRSLLLLWSAAIGLALLLLARLLTMTADMPKEMHQFFISMLVSVALPPILTLGIIGIGIAALQEIVKSPFRFRKRGWRPVARVVLSGVAILGLSYLITAAVTLTSSYFGKWLLFLGWIAVLALPSAASHRWSSMIRIPFSTILFRASLCLSLLVLILLAALTYPDQIKAFWVELTHPLGDENSANSIGTACIAFLLGPIFALCLNLLIPRAVAASRHFRSQWASGLEDLIYSANRRSRLVMLTLANRKVYIGHINWIAPHPEAKDAYIKIVPYFSGYRTMKTHQVKLRTSYGEIYRELNQRSRKQAQNARKSFTKVIPISKILVAGEFDPKHYMEFLIAESGFSTDGGPTGDHPNTT
jgi:hypothetical protein